MAITEDIYGCYVDLRSCTECDAEFTRSIRKDPDFARFFPAIENTIEQQRQWICLQREKKGDYFFVVWDKQENRIGTISIYDVDGNHAESGRLAIKGGNPFQAIEAQLLSFRFAFETLNLECIDGFIFSENSRAIRFNRMFGGKHYPAEIDSDGRSIVRIENWREDFFEAETRIKKMLYRKKGSDHNE